MKGKMIMKKFTKIVALAVSVILIVCAFSACTGNGTGEESQNEGAASGAVKKIGIIQLSLIHISEPTRPY